MPVIFPRINLATQIVGQVCNTFNIDNNNAFEHVCLRSDTPFGVWFVLNTHYVFCYNTYYSNTYSVANPDKPARKRSRKYVPKNMNDLIDVFITVE